jgi:hypothetical protein
MMILEYGCVEDHLASQRVFFGRFLRLVNNSGYQFAISFFAPLYFVSIGLKAAIPVEPASPVFTGSAALAFRKP